MVVIRWLVRIALALVALVALVFGLARLHDGPWGPVPGGPLEAGELVPEPVADWSFAKDEGEIELQLASQSRSRTTWILVNGGQAYIPCSLGFPPGKSWHERAIEDGRAVLRIAGRRYPVTLSKLDAAALQPIDAALEAEVARKYPSRPPEGDGVWIFRVISRTQDHG
jgi:hypothetical protein